jgi:hypothetical protein
VEVEMLDRDEREALREIELRIAAADPDLAALLRGERSILRTGTRTCLRAVLGLLVLLVVALLALGLPASALAVAAVAAALGWKWHHHETPLRRTGRP